MATRSHTGAGSAKGGATRPRKGRGSSHKAAPASRRPSRIRPVRAAVVLTVMIGFAALAYIPVVNYLELRSELSELQREAAELDADLDAAHRNARLAESRNEERARCYANYVEPGTESYSIPGGVGCAP